MKTPNFKLQTSGKLQNPSLKGWEQGRNLSYPELLPQTWVLKDEPDGHNGVRHPFDLEERTAQFGEAVVRFCKKVPHDPRNNRLIDQLVGCGTSVGANYVEASECVSRKDFRFSISHCVKEAKEAKFFLRMVAASEPNLVDEARKLYREGHELHLIFATMFRRGQK